MPMPGQILRQALPGQAAPEAPAPWANPYQGQLDQANAAMAAPQAPAYSPEEIETRKAANSRAYKYGLLGLMMGSDGEQKAGGQVLQQALAARAPKVSDRGSYDPISGQMTVNPEFQKDRLENRQQRAQDMFAGASDRQQSREDQQAFQAQQMEENRAARLAQMQISREQLGAQKQSAKDQKNMAIASQWSDHWHEQNKQDLGIRASFQNLLSTPAGAEGDVSFIYQYMKMLDPNSAVKEGEFATAKNAAGIPDRIRNVWNNALNGNLIAPQQRAEMLAAGHSLAANADNRISQKNTFYKSKAQAAGIDPNLVVPSYGEPMFTTDQAGAAPVNPGNPALPKPAPVNPGATTGVGAPAPTRAAPPVGTRHGQFVFRGGDAADAANWVKS